MRRLITYGESGTILTPEALSSEIVRAGRELDTASASTRMQGGPMQVGTDSITLSAAVEEIERRMIQDALRRSSGNIARAAKDLGLSRKGLYLKMDRLNF